MSMTTKEKSGGFYLWYESEDFDILLGITHDDGRKSEKNDCKRRIWKEVI
jgi:hypothetical protein